MFAIFSWPLNPQIAVALESIQQPNFGDVPWHSPDKDLAGVNWVAVDPRRQDAAPSARGLADGGGVTVETRRAFDGKRIVGRSAKELVRTGRPL